MIQMVSLGDICDIKIGRTPPRKQPQWFSESHGMKWVSIKDMGNTGKYISQTSEFLTVDAIKKFNIPIIPAGTLLMSFKLTVGRLGFTEYDMCSNEAIAQLPIKDPDIVDKNYLYYYLKNFNFGSLSSTSSIATAVNSKTVKNISVNLPPLDRQKKIANILGSLDEKIELNRRMNETLEQLGQALFRHYFVDNPESKNWKKRPLGEFFPVKTGKKDANFGIKDGKFPFFTCAQTISRAPSYSFDGSAILVAGNGDFNIKYYTGKFEAYQRTYVLIPHNEELLGFLYFLMKKDLSLITGGSRGSVIKFITKGMIENYRVELPDDNNLAAFAPIFSELLALISHNNEQVYNLIALRDTLLPQLMSGKVGQIV